MVGIVNWRNIHFGVSRPHSYIPDLKLPNQEFMNVALKHKMHIFFSCVALFCVHCTCIICEGFVPSTHPGIQACVFHSSILWWVFGSQITHHICGLPNGRFCFIFLKKAILFIFAKKKNTKKQHTKNHSEAHKCSRWSCATSAGLKKPSGSERSTVIAFGRSRSANPLVWGGTCG